METLISAVGAVPSLLLVALGLGFVIFLHELGHFLVAKWAGVHVKAFSIGFPPTFLSWRKGLGFRLGSSAKEYEARLKAAQEGGGSAGDVRALGETEYVLSWIPLGGYVSMVGEDPQDAEHASDPRSFHNKPVGKRMLIISAGVTMNVILGLACFIFAYSRGMTEMPAVVGAVLPGTPAFETGIRAGDEIVAVDGQSDVTYLDFKQAVAYSGRDQTVHLDLRRPGRSEPIRIDVRPRRERTGTMPTVGIYPAYDLLLDEREPIEPKPGFGAADVKDAESSLKDARILKVGPKGGPLREVRTAADLDAELARLRDRPIDFEVRRPGVPRKGGSKVETATLPPNRVVDLGLVMTAGPVAAVAAGSPARAAGFQKGDRIIKVRGWDDFDPMRLPDYAYRHAGDVLEIEVRRPSPVKPDGAIEVLKVRPDATPPWNFTNGFEGLLDVPGLGLAYKVSPTVAAVREGSPAAGKVKPGDEVRAVSLLGARSVSGTRKLIDLTFDDQANDWVVAFEKLQNLPLGPVSLSIKGAKEPIEIAPALIDDWFNPDRGLRLLALTRPLPPQGVLASIRRGLKDTRETIASVFAMVSGLAQRQISPENVAGPIRIFGIGRQVAVAGLAPFIHFLGLLSVNLAVINILPIPPLDGGQLAFLVAEKLRGRPLPERAQAAGLYAGLAFVLCLMAFVIFQDIKHQF